MPKFFVKRNQIKDNQIEVIGEDVNHIKNVLRKNIGDILEICNQDDRQNYRAEITAIDNYKIKCKVTEIIEAKAESNLYINIFQGLPKSDKMELIIQKSIELGASEITPVAMKRCVVKIKEKDEPKKLQRWQKISETASKQCGRDIVPKINNIVKIKDIRNITKDYDVVLVAYELEKDNKLKKELEILKKQKNKSYFNKKTSNIIKIAIIIGPEGGLDIEEVNFLKENGAKVITLGERILRTETVALNMISVITYEFEN